ncbi:MAG: glycosyltransferase, partial [Actinomycetota bacterium]|nr:glycosyltransferase [Actinomycetota bacterium]
MPSLSQQDSTHRRGVPIPQGRRRGKRATVAICIATCQRPLGLRTLLRSLDELTFSRGRDVDVRVVVVDNSSAGDAAASERDLQEEVRWPLEVLHEPRRGIPFARNAAVRHALPDADYLAFVDDDEIVSPHWLDRLLDGLERYRAEIATGPVLPIYPDGIPPWMIRGRLFERDRFPTGTRRPVAYTGNVLVRHDVFTHLDHHFDESLALTGGEDKEFFTRAAELGHKIVWIDDAEVSERVPPSRATLRWLLRRRYMRANLTANALRRQHGAGSRENLGQLAAALVRVMSGPLRALVALPEGRHVAASRLRDLALNLGRLTGSIGLRAEEYRRVHGDPAGTRPIAARTGLDGPMFIVPFDETRHRGPVAGLLGAAALTLAARDRHGDAWLLGPAGWLDPREIRANSWGAAQSAPGSGITPRLPLVLKTALKDARRLVRVALLNRSLGSLPLPARNPAYVWQR